MPSKKKPKKKGRKRPAKSGKKYRLYLIATFALATLMPLSAQPPETPEPTCGAGCVSRQAAEAALDENDRIWETEMASQLRRLATELEGRVAGLEVERDTWRKAAQTATERANRLERLSWVLGGTTVAALAAALILGLI